MLLFVLYYPFSHNLRDLYIVCGAQIQSSSVGNQTWDTSMRTSCGEMALGRWYIIKGHHFASTWHVFQNTWCPVIGSSQSFTLRMVQWQITRLSRGLFQKLMTINDLWLQEFAIPSSENMCQHLSISLSKASSFDPLRLLQMIEGGYVQNFASLLSYKRFGRATCLNTTWSPEHWR